MEVFFDSSVGIARPSSVNPTRWCPSSFTGHATGTGWLEVPTICKAYFSILNFRDYPHNIWPNIWYSTSILGSWNYHWTVMNIRCFIVWWMIIVEGIHQNFTILLGSKLSVSHGSRHSAEVSPSFSSNFIMMSLSANQFMRPRGPAVIAGETERLWVW
jgi:hypothetical protein